MTLGRGSTSVNLSPLQGPLRVLHLSPERMDAMRIRSSASILMGLLFLCGCEEPFEPLAPSDLTFSIYGHLDAASDTQWVRVTPIRETLQTFPGPIDAVVTLEEIETGRVVVMLDSLTRYIPAFVGEAEAFAHNFSAAIRPVPGWHYRVTATRSDGATSSATVLISVFESPTLEVRYRFFQPSRDDSPHLREAAGVVRGTRYLGMVLGREDIPSECDLPHPVHQEYLPIIRPAMFEGDVHNVQLSWAKDWPIAVPPVRGPSDNRPNYVPRAPACDLGPKRVSVIASGEPWAYDPAASLRDVGHPSTINNIEGGIGFLAGVQTHVFPFAVCSPTERTADCTITFTPESATLAGRVTNPCTGQRFKGIRAVLRSDFASGIRSDTTDSTGAFLFTGLAPGTPHSLTLSELAPGDFLPVELADLVLGEAEVDTVSVEMIHRRNCVP